MLPVGLAKLSASLRLWFRPDYEKDNSLARDVFKNAARADAHAMPGKPRRLFFTRLGVLATARLALTACDNANGTAIEEPAAAAQILACCLMMNQLAATSEPITGVADLLVHQLANHNAMAHYDFRADLVRSLQMFERNRELLANQTGLVDLEAEFKRATGLSPRQFVELCLVIGTRARALLDAVRGRRQGDQGEAGRRIRARVRGVPARPSSPRRLRCGRLHREPAVCERRRSLRWTLC